MISSVKCLKHVFDFPAGVWSLETGVSGGGLDNCLVVSFVGQTTFLSLCGEEVEETEIPGLVADQQTYHCGNIGGKRIVQVRVCVYVGGGGGSLICSCVHFI